MKVSSSAVMSVVMGNGMCSGSMRGWNRKAIDEVMELGTGQRLMAYAKTKNGWETMRVQIHRQRDKV